MPGLPEYAVGAAKNTTADIFLQRNFARGTRKVVLPRAADAVDELKRRSIDIFLPDAPYVLWMVSANEATLSALWEPFDLENLAWGSVKGKTPFMTKGRLCPGPRKADERRGPGRRLGRFVKILRPLPERKSGFDP